MIPGEIESVSGPGAPATDLVDASLALDSWWEDLSSAEQPVPLPEERVDFPLLEQFKQKFALNDFEISLVLILGLVEIDPGALSRLGSTAGLNLAMFQHLFPGDYDPGALLEGSPLVHWQLVVAQANRFESVPLVHRPLNLHPRILNHLMGRAGIDPELSSYLEQEGSEPVLTPNQVATARNATALMAQAAHFEAHVPLLLQGRETETLRAVAWECCRQAGLGLVCMRAERIPAAPSERRDLIRRWQQEALLSESALYIDATDLRDDDPALGGLIDWATVCHGALLIGAGSRIPLPARVVRLPVPDTSAAEREEMMRAMFNGDGGDLEGHFEQLAEQFPLSAAGIYWSCRRTQALVEDAAAPVADLLWEQCREQAQPRSEHLMQCVRSTVDWDDLVLPGEAMAMLRKLSAQVRNRSKVYRDWGFAAKSRRGLNFTALFSGASGTGKTLAAEIIANELRLNLMRVDLSAVVSKYIGETEENLREVFAAAERGGVVLLFDEADALFGPRSKVSDSRDRNANIEVSYLLQRLEAFGGLAILTTNFKENLDQAFLRRIRFHVEFPFPDRATRKRIWKAVFPPDTPLEGVDFDRVSRLSLTGGHIRNIALNAAFLAAEEKVPVRNHHLASAARSEFRKSEKPLPERELRALGLDGGA